MATILFHLWLFTFPFQCFFGAWWLRGRYEARKLHKSLRRLQDSQWPALN